MNHRVMLVVLALLSLGLSRKAASLPTQTGSQTLSPPQHMRLCINSGTGCNVLTWAGDHYDGTFDGQTRVVAKYWVIHWGRDYVELRGRTTDPAGGGYPAEGTFTGTISADGVTLENARDDWNVGPTTRGTMPFSLTWGTPKPPPAPQTPSYPVDPLVAERDRQNAGDFAADGCPLKPSDEPPASAFQDFQQAVEGFYTPLDEGARLHSLKLFCRAAKHGYCQAAYKIGDMYENGFGLPSIHSGARSIANFRQRDFGKAFEWYLKAAEMGDSEAMVAVAAYFFFGPKMHFRSGSLIITSPIPLDIAKGLQWENKAADLGDTQALQRLADYYAVAPDPSLQILEPDPAKARSMRLRWAAQVLRSQAACIARTPEISEKLRSNERLDHVETIFSHTHSKVCIANFNDDNGKVESPSDALSALQGDIWHFAVYDSQDHREKWTSRASVAEEAQNIENDMATMTALAKLLNKQP